MKKLINTKIFSKLDLDPKCQGHSRNQKLIIKVEHGELSKPQTVAAALEGADFATFATSEKTPNWNLTCKRTECPVY